MLLSMTSCSDRFSSTAAPSTGGGIFVVRPAATASLFSHSSPLLHRLVYGLRLYARRLGGRRQEAAPLARCAAERQWQPGHLALAGGEPTAGWDADAALRSDAWRPVSGIHPGYRKEGSRQTPSIIPLYSY
jgi:hypothetical protein